MGARFEMDAADRPGAARYLVERAYQALADGFRPTADEVEPLCDPATGVEWGARALARARDGRVFQTVYVYATHRGQGHLSRYLGGTPLPVVTIPDCAIEAYLQAKQVPFVVIGRRTEWREYRAIQDHYGDRSAARSRVPYMHHIDEGLAVLEDLGATEQARRAFCLHPLFQADADLARTYALGSAVTDDPAVLTLVMEYRNIANGALSHRSLSSASDIALSPLAEVNAMLIADKVQNRKDFILHHRRTHARSEALDRYFALWLERLGVVPERFATWFVDLQVTSSPIGLEEALSSGPSPATTRGQRHTPTT